MALFGHRTCSACQPLLTVLPACLQHLNADVNLAWPSARIGVRGPDGTRQLIFSARASLLSGSSRDRQGRAAAAGPEAPRIARPLAASQYGIVDAVIRPAMTRKHLCRELALLQVRCRLSCVHCLPKLHP